MIIGGNYYLNLKFGDMELNISPQMMAEMSVTMDVDRLLPTFKISLKDPTSILGEIVPFDKNSNNINIEFARSRNASEFNNMNLMVKRRKPDSDKLYTIEGVLDVKNLLTSLYSRALTGNIKTNLKTIVKEDLELSDTDAEIGASLDYDKTIIQTKWTNAVLLDYLKNNLEGRNGEACYYCFIKNVNGKPIFVFKSLDELLSQEVKFNFMVAPKEYVDTQSGISWLPIIDYKIFDNSQLVCDLGAQSQSFGYFNYDTGEYVNDSISINEVPAIAEKFLVDSDNLNDSIYLFKFGRNNSFTPDFHGRAKTSYYKRMNNFINMWITTYGTENIAPGDLVKLVFNEALKTGRLFLYQHAGLWMVQRVVHIFGQSYMTNVLLTRCGIDTDSDTTLLSTENVKRKI